jgi:hypothetical protein
MFINAFFRKTLIFLIFFKSTSPSSSNCSPCSSSSLTTLSPHHLTHSQPQKSHQEQQQQQQQQYGTHYNPNINQSRSNNSSVTMNSSAYYQQPHLQIPLQQQHQQHTPYQATTSTTTSSNYNEYVHGLQWFPAAAAAAAVHHINLESLANPFNYSNLQSKYDGAIKGDPLVVPDSTKVSSTHLNSFYTQNDDYNTNQQQHHHQQQQQQQQQHHHQSYKPSTVESIDNNLSFQNSNTYSSK